MVGFEMTTRSLSQLIVAAAWIAALSSAAAAQQESEALQVVADQVRTQGYACANPQGIQRDPDLSRPDLPVWILTCENNRYRVELVPDMQAKVTQLD
jgi:plasmid stabilization system protein ParE